MRKPFTKSKLAVSFDYTVWFFLLQRYRKVREQRRAVECNQSIYGCRNSRATTYTAQPYWELPDRSDGF